CLFRVDGAIGLKVNNQLVKIRSLLNTGRFNHIGNAQYRAKAGIELQTTDGASLIFVVVAGICRQVAATANHAQTHIQTAFPGDIGDYMIRVFNLYTAVMLDIAGGYNTWAGGIKSYFNILFAMNHNGNTFEVKKNFNHIF